jgi:hypothetical protein
MFITPDTLHSAHGMPTAFPFQQPTLPQDMRQRAPTHAQAGTMRFSEVNPYDSDAYQRRQALKRQAMMQAPAMVESLASIHRIASTNNINNMLGAGGAIATPAAVTTPLPPMNQASPYPTDPQLEAMSASHTIPIPSPAAAAPTDPSSFDAARFSQTQAQSRAQADAQAQSALAAEAQAQAEAMAQTQASESAAATASSFPGSSMPPPPASVSSVGSSVEHSSASLSHDASSGSSFGSMPSPHTPEPPSAHGSQSFSHSSDSHSHSGSMSGPTPISHPKPLHKCIPSTKNSCVVDFDPNTIPWTVVTVPHLEGCNPGSVSTGSSQSSACSGASQEAHTGSSSLSESAHPHHHHEYSSNPEVARAQKHYYEKQDEVLREKRWVAEVERIIAEYQYKIKNVQKHTRIEQAQMRKDKKSIMAMIKAEKSAKLEAELHAALESLKKLETTSSALNSKMTELTQTKTGLRHTISKIQRVIGSSPSSIASSSSLMEVGETVDPEQVNAREEANNGAKQLFSNLLELLGKTKQRHRAMSTSHLADSLQQRMRRSRRAPASEEEDHRPDLSHISARASAIAQKYATEENNRLHTNLPLRALSAREYKKADEDRDDFLD